MTQTTNPYQTWLGLNVAGRPDCYTLLGLPMYEADQGKIMVAAQNAMARASIPMAPADEPLRQMLVSEIQLAQNCLLDPTQKQSYDQQLHAYFSSQNTPAAPVATPVQASAPVQAAPAAVAAPASMPMGSKPSDSSGDINLKSKKSSAASSAKNRARKSSFALYAGGGSILLLAAIAGGAYYALKEPTPEPVAQLDPAPVTPVEQEPEPSDEETVDPRGTRKPPRPPKGDRPTSQDLANSIPGLGNPEETMAGMPEMSAKPPEPKVTPQDEAALKTALMNAWTGIASRDFAKASIALDEVRKTPKTPAGTADFERVDQFVQDLMAYTRALNEGTSGLRENEELTVGSTSFTVTTLDGNRVVIRYAGHNRGYDRNELPEGFLRAIAKSRLKGDDAQKKRIEASHLLLSPKADIEYVRNLWMQSGADGGALTALEAEKKKYMPGEMVATAPKPDMSTEMTSTPNDEPTMPAAADPPMEMAGGDIASAEMLTNLMNEARTQLVERNPAAAAQAIAQAEPLATIPAHQKKVAQLKQLVDLNQKFWQAVSGRLAKLPPDEDLDVNGKIVRVVESDANRLVIRVDGENKRYTLSDLPAGLAKFLAETELPTSADSKKIVGAFLLVTPEGGAEKARETWATAFLSDEEMDALIGAMGTPLNLANDLIKQVPVPPESEIAAPAAKFLEKWSAQIQSAMRLDDHAKVGRDMAADAKSLPNGSPGQFAGFRYALAETARGGDFEACNEIITDWSVRFAIEPGEWHLKAMQLAATSSTSSKVHAAIAQHAIDQVPQFKAAGQGQVASQMVKLAEESASKSRDKAIVDAVKQLGASQ